MKIKPETNISYGWSEEQLYWKDAMKGCIALSCRATSKDDKSVYYFQAEAVYDKRNLWPMCTTYEISGVCTIEIENLLPFDFKYRLYDKHARKDWTGRVEKGVKSYVHVVNLESLLLLSVEPVNTSFKKSEFAVINHPKKSEFERKYNYITRC